MNTSKVRVEVVDQFLLQFSFRLVIETLSEVSPDRKCFRMIGGVLVERTVKEVLPALEANRDKASFNPLFFTMSFHSNQCTYRSQP